jgi:RNA polymerase sigma factor (sigma-70 family)
MKKAKKKGRLEPDETLGSSGQGELGKQDPEIPKEEKREPQSVTQETLDHGHQEQQNLVDRCRDGDEFAWEQMHAQCQAYVLRQIRYMLRDRARDADLVEEIAARVWFGLVSHDGYLLNRFEPKNGSGLKNYLAAIARFEVLRHLRGEFRRKRREHETRAMRVSDRDDRLLADIAMDVNDFLPQLTPREQEFFHHVLLGNNGHHLRISAPNAWQLKHRIRKKLLEFLEMA